MRDSAPGVVALTGLATRVGAELTRRLVERPALRVVGIDRRRPYRLDGRVRFHSVDLTEATADARLAEVLRSERVEVLVHTAFRSQPGSDLELDHELETLGSLHVIHACAAAKVARFVLASSTMLYGPRPDNPNFLSEQHPLRGHPQAHSVANRIEVEALVAGFRERYPDTEVSVLRPCWMLGPGATGPIANYLSLPLVPVLMGYDPLIQLVHESDCLHAFESAALESHPGVFNVVGSGVLPVSTLLRSAGRRALPLPSPLLYGLLDLPSRAGSGDPPAAFYDYLRYLWVADGRRGWDEFGEPHYSTAETWMSFVGHRRLRRYQ